MEPMSTLRSRVGVAVMNGLLYAIGGFNGHERLRTVEVFNPETRQWREVWFVVFISIITRFINIGRWLRWITNDRHLVPLSSPIVYMFAVDMMELHRCRQSNATMRHWIDGRCWMEWVSRDRRRELLLLTERYTVSYDYVIYLCFAVMGGHDGMSIFDSVERYDPETGVWKTVKSMQNRRCRLGATSFNGKLYACGGYVNMLFSIV